MYDRSHEPPFGDAEQEALRLLLKDEREHGPNTAAYPPARDRDEFCSEWPGQRFKRYETSRGYVSLGTAESTLIHFSGYPDVIELFVLDNAAIFSFDEDPEDARDEIRVEANNFYEPAIRAHRVRARNATDGLVARVQVVGKWVSR